MRIRTVAAAAIVIFVLVTSQAAQQSTRFTVEQVLGFPSPENLVASPVGSMIAWTFNERGVRNIYIAQGPDFQAKRLTSYTQDDGQELTQLAFTPNGGTIVYVRGGDHGGRPAETPPNPAGDTIQPKIQIWAVSVEGGAPRLIADGDSPAIAPDSRRIAFVRDKKIWLAPLDGGAAQQAFSARGTSDSPVWSPDGQTLAFVSDRTDHSFIGLFSPGRPIRFIAPSTSRDSLPAWTADGRRLAFLRQPGIGGTPRSPLAQPEAPWDIMIADFRAESPEGDIPVTSAVSSGTKNIDRILQNPSGIAFRWAVDETLVFMSYRDGFPHIYALPRGSITPKLLTPGKFMVEQMTVAPDGRHVIYSANTGANRDDIDRRHLFRMNVDGLGTPEILTGGTGIEWGPVVTADGQTVAFLQSTAQQPPAPAVMPVRGGTPRRLATDRLPSDYPGAQLVTPELVSFRASDGVEAYGQLFKAATGPARRPAVVYIHGGGPRQMLLGFHNRWEYANDYAANQYLVSRGFIVLSVDYRLSVGYGKDFQFPENTGPRGAAEYRDVLAAGRYLQSRPDVERRRIGVWGASLGGYLTALALGRNSEVFAAGVDVHGVHDRLAVLNPAQFVHALVGDGITEEDLKDAMRVQFESSPIAAVPTWRSPVLLIHGDDDRIVEFKQSIDLKRRLQEKGGVQVEELVLPDDVHDSLLWRNWIATVKATAAFFEKTLRPDPVY